MNYPWSDPVKKLKKAFEESENETPIRYNPVEFHDFIESLKHKKYPIWERVWNKIHFAFYDFVWYVYRLFKPCNQRIRKVIPREWCDLTELTLLLNFEIVKSFVEDEMDDIEWNSDDGHKRAAVWLNSAYKYITKDRVQLFKELDEAHDKVDHRCLETYQEKYADVIRIENTIDEQDKSVIIGIANYRRFLWS
jgi:hypothetical protein